MVAPHDTVGRWKGALAVERVEKWTDVGFQDESG